MVDPDREPDDPDSPVHDLIQGLLETTQAVALPEGIDGLSGALQFPRGLAWVIATGFLLLDKRLAMNERNRG